MLYEPDYEAISRETFGSAEAGELLRQAVRHFEKYQADLSSMLPPARRQASFRRMSKTATKLLQQLSSLDATDGAYLFRDFSSAHAKDASEKAEGGLILPSDAIGRPSKHEGFQRFSAFGDDLSRLASNATCLANAESNFRAGRPDRSDIIAFAIESLAAIWRQQTRRTMTRSMKVRGFGAFARQVLTAPPLSFNSTSVWHAVHQFLSSNDLAAPS